MHKAILNALRPNTRREVLRHIADTADLIDTPRGEVLAFPAPEWVVNSLAEFESEREDLEQEDPTELNGDEEDYSPCRK